MEINKGIEPFDDRLDVSRTNPDRKPFGKSEGAGQFHLGNEYEIQRPVVIETNAEQPVNVVTPTPPKFSHKLANGTVLEAATVEELAGMIERSLVQAPPAPVEFEDKPVYEPIQFKRTELSLADQANILNVWKENPQKAMRMLQEAEYGVPMDTILQRLDRGEQLELQRAQEVAGLEFLGECDTYNATATNAKKLTTYLKEKGKPITKQNLVLSFQQLVAAGDKSLLRKVEEQVTPESAPANDPSLTEVPPPPSSVPVNQGRPETPQPGQVDVAKFASLTLDQQKEFLRRGGR